MALDHVIEKYIKYELTGYRQSIRATESRNYCVIVYAVGSAQRDSFQEFGVLTREGEAITINVLPFMRTDEWNNVRPGSIISFYGCPGDNEQWNGREWATVESEVIILNQHLTLIARPISDMSPKSRCAMIVRSGELMQRPIGETFERLTCEAICGTNVILKTKIVEQIEMLKNVVIGSVLHIAPVKLSIDQSNVYEIICFQGTVLQVNTTHVSRLKKMVGRNARPPGSAQTSLPSISAHKFDFKNKNSSWIGQTMNWIRKQHPSLKFGLKELFNELDTSLNDRFNFESRIGKWSRLNERQMVHRPPDTVESPFADNLPMKKNLPSIVEEILKNDITIIEAPTGTGKSIQMPCAIHHVVKIMANDDDHPEVEVDAVWRALHLVPTGEQVIQLHQICSEAYKKAEDDDIGIDTSMNFGLYTSAIDNFGIEQKHVQKMDNYVFATTFFGPHAFNGSLFAIIIDEVHELTPEVVFLLWLVRGELQKNVNERAFVKVVLISATLSEERRKQLLNYLELDGSIKVASTRFGNKLHNVNTESLGEDDGSFLSKTLGIKHPDHWYKEEEKEGQPNLLELNERGCKLLKGKFNEWMRNDYKKIKDPGIISFHPGQNDLNQLRSKIARSAELRRYDSQGYGKVDIKKVCGKDRADMPFLRTAWTTGDPTRLVFSTALLATGVTIYGISSVIDNGTIKIPGPYNRRGVFDLELIWEDQAMRDQKKGRVGRTGDGTFFELFSKKRSEEIGRNDLTLIKLDRAYRTNHVPFFFNILSDILIEMNKDTWIELLQECMTIGMIETVNLNGASFSRYSSRISRAFSTISLDQADFLVRGRSLGVGLFCAVYLASRNAEHAGLRSAHGDQFGRDDPLLPINYWAEVSGQIRNGDQRPTDSDFETITEATFNLMLCGKATFVFDTFKIPHKIFIEPKIVEHLRDADRIEEIFRNVCIYANGLRSLGLLKKDDDEGLFNEMRTSMEYVYKEGCSYYRLKPQYNVLFRAVVLASFGQRVAIRALPRDQKGYGQHTMYYIPGDPLDTSEERQTQLCQGEMAVKTPREMAVYDVMMKRSPNDWFLNGALHYVDAEEYAVYGNVLGAERDEADWKEFVLKIQTSSAPVYYKFEYKEILEDVLNLRLIFKYLPECTLFYRSVAQDYINLVIDMILKMDSLYRGKSTKYIGATATLKESNFVLARLNTSSDGSLLSGMSKPWPTTIERNNPLYGTTMIKEQYKPREKKRLEVAQPSPSLNTCRSSSSTNSLASTQASSDHVADDENTSSSSSQVAANTDDMNLSLSQLSVKDQLGDHSNSNDKDVVDSTPKSNDTTDNSITFSTPNSVLSELSVSTAQSIIEKDTSSDNVIGKAPTLATASTQHSISSRSVTPGSSSSNNPLSTAKQDYLASDVDFPSCLCYTNPNLKYPCPDHVYRN